MNKLVITLDYLNDIKKPKYIIDIETNVSKWKYLIGIFIGDGIFEGNTEKTIVDSINKYLDSNLDINFLNMDRHIVKTPDYIEYVKTLPKGYSSIEADYMAANNLKEQYEEFLETLPDDKRKLINAYNDHFRL